MKIGLITGASSGMGKEFAKVLGKRGLGLDQLWIVGRNQKALKELQEQTPLPCKLLCLDLSIPEGLKHLKEELEIIQPRIKILVVSAGYGKSGRALDLPVEEQIGMIDVNCKALTYVTLTALPYMERKDRIILMGSAAAFVPQPNFSVYAATKAYVLSFARSLREELRPRKIKVTCVCPGPVDTAFFKRSGPLQNPAKQAAMVSPKPVVDKALKDSLFGKSLSIYSWPMKMGYVCGKVLPTKIIFWFFRWFHKEETNESH